MQILLVYMYLLNMLSASSRYLYKIKTNVSFREMAHLIARNSLRELSTERLGSKYAVLTHTLYIRGGVKRSFHTPLTPGVGSKVHFF